LETYETNVEAHLMSVDRFPVERNEIVPIFQILCTGKRISAVAGTGAQLSGKAPFRKRGLFPANFKLFCLSVRK
jgi:hypothetical protein